MLTTKESNAAGNDITTLWRRSGRTQRQATATPHTLFKLVQPSGFPLAHTNAYLRVQVRIYTRHKTHGRQHRGEGTWVRGLVLSVASRGEYGEQWQPGRLSWEKSSVCSQGLINVLSAPKTALHASTIDMPQASTCRASSPHLQVSRGRTCLPQSQPEARDGAMRTTHLGYATHLHHALGSSSGEVLGRNGKNACQLARAVKESLRESTCSYCSARKSIFMLSI